MNNLLFKEEHSPYWHWHSPWTVFFNSHYSFERK
uniref:Uncharacterized protein n=1 Tax=Rhizophora mucronata TaxID=61149 RepID=A0A2P2PB60_RHIMU